MISKSPCQNCGNNIEFEAEYDGEMTICPHCGCETLLFATPAGELLPLSEKEYKIKRFFEVIPSKQSISEPDPVGSILMMLLGSAAVVLIMLFMDTTAPGTTTLNIGLLNDKLCAVIISVGITLLGAVFMVRHQLKKPAKKTEHNMDLPFFSLVLAAEKSEPDSWGDKNHFKKLEILADAGDLNAQNTLGCHFLRGGSKEAAQSYFKKSADKGNAMAYSNLGVCLFNEGIYTPALQNFKTSASLGETTAFNNIGVLFETGAILRKDLEQAKKHYLAAAAAADPISQYNLGMLYYNSDKNPDYFEATKWLERSKEKFKKANSKWFLASFGSDSES